MSITRYRFPKQSPKWLQFRMRGYGGSEIASVLSQYSEHLAAHSYGSPVQVHLSKIGEPVPVFTGNVRTLAGQMEERDIIDCCRYYDFDNPSVEDMYRRRLAKEKKLNKIIGTDNSVITLVNTDYPWLLYSPDAFHYTEDGKIINIEAKNTNSLEANRYEGGLNPSFVCQVQQGLIVTGHEAASIIRKIDGVIHDPIHIELDKEWKDFILDYSYQSWQNVLEAREIKRKYGITNYFGVDPEYAPEIWVKPLDELNGNSPLGILQALEPEFIGVDSELEFIRQMIIPKPDEFPMEISDGQWEVLVDYYKAFNIWKKHKNEVSKHQNKLIMALNGYNKAVLKDNEQAYYSWKKDKNGKDRFYISTQLQNMF